MNQMPDAFRESRAISAEGDDRNLHISKLRARCERDDATMEPVEAIALNLVRAVAVATDIVAKANLPWMQIQLHWQRSRKIKHRAGGVPLLGRGLTSDRGRPGLRVVGIGARRA
jgi:hypothetical protein